MLTESADTRPRGVHASKRAADTHHPYRQPAAPARADPALCAPRARRAGRPPSCRRPGKAALHAIVPKQAEAGIDIGSNGEQQRDSFLFYIRDRLSGLGGSWQRRQRADVERYPVFKKESYEASLRQESVDDIRGLPKAIGAIAYPDAADVKAECADFRGDARCGRKPVHRAVPDRALARHGVGDRAQRALSDRGGVPGRARRRVARRIQGDRRRRLPAAARLPGPRAREAQHLRGPADRGLHRVRQPRGRRDQHRDPRHSAREGAAARVLGQLRRPARPRCRAAGDHPVPAARQGRRLRLAVRQPAPRA